MPVSKNLLDVGKLFEDNATQTLEKTEPKVKPKISSKLLDMGKRIDFLNKELLPSESTNTDEQNKLILQQDPLTSKTEI